MDKLIQLKKESMNLEIMLKNKKNSVAALEAYDSLKQIFEKIEKMDKYQPIGRVRLVRIFLESDLSEDKDLFSCYGRFANLVEGVEV
jgi:hypothetical protein